MSDKKSSSRFNYLPVVFSIILCGGIYIGTRLQNSSGKESSFFSLSPAHFNKINDIITYIEQEYVDTINREQLTDRSVEKLLQSLDPHSAYIPASELNAANEPLEGNFEGIGVEFHIQDDTIMVVSAIPGGPSDKAGIRSGDRIVKVNDTIIAGVGITNSQVMQRLRGTGGTKVRLGIFRRGFKQIREYAVIRGKIPIYSLDASFMVNDSTGYFRISRFAATTYDEFMQAAKKLTDAGMKQLIIDLRGNGGGYLDAATRIADEFIEKGKTIVYTQGRSRPRTDYEATAGGRFEKSRVVILIDEGSASASEILSGALQDWDRAVIVGRRSFGKGLVQEQTILPDGSALRLTIARYYTPTGRCIQKPYDHGFENYNNELLDRIDHKELLSADSIKLPDSLKFVTPGGKTVFGGGGIMPDVFVPLDTTGNSNPFLIAALSGSTVADFAYNYVDQNRNRLLGYKDAEQFRKEFVVTDLLYKQYANTLAAEYPEPFSQKDIMACSAYLKNQLMAFISRQLFREDGFYPIWLQTDPTFKRAVLEMGSNSFGKQSQRHINQTRK